jgi:beta-glucanase (GH16 family)
MNSRPTPPRHRLPPGPRRPWVVAAVAVVAACLLVVIALALANASPADPAGAVPPVPAGYTQVFLDNFGGPKGAPPSALNWRYDIGTDWGNHQVEHDTNSTGNIYLDGHGDLIIQANESNGKWTSGRIETARDDFTAPPGGKLEMTASVEQPNVPDAIGYWPAFWALGSSIRTGGQWPKIGELDMFEDVNGLNQASQTMHDANSYIQHPLTPCPATSCEGGFNTYSVIIDRTHVNAEFLEFLIDGQVEQTVTEAQVGTSTWQAAIDHGFFMLLDLAMGGPYPNGKCGCTSPTAVTTSGGQLKVAYVAAYESGA